MRLVSLLLAAATLAPSTSLAFTQEHLRVGTFLGITPGARRPFTGGIEIAGGLLPESYSVSVLSELLLRAELRAGRTFQTSLGVRESLAAGQGGASGGVLAGLALRTDGAHGLLLGASAAAGFWTEGRVTVDAVLPFSGPQLRVRAPRVPHGIEGHANPLAYRVRGGLGPKTSPLIEPTLTAAFAGVARTTQAYAIDGRPCRVDGDPVLADVLVLGALTEAARAWVDRGREEAASVGVFVQLARDLAALGAPRALIGRALRAAEEEVAHALLCYGAAEALAGVTVLPLSWPAPDLASGDRRARLTRIAREALADGIEGEGAAADRAEANRDTTVDPLLAAVEARIAFEERGHADLAKDLLVWARREGASLRAA
ncbi:MAG: ferritin-like domain-containing protein [Deltaproteobacteria bacterium]|nr:MAG: ferritin-like domain-containing protein [Deltaproteobacteria bacterium]